EVQMLASTPNRRALPKRPSNWSFERLDTLRHRIIQRAGRITRPGGVLTLTMSANDAVQKDLLHFLAAIQNAA
ncbi:MAG: IS1380 family transposase, partial [Desulfobacterales bacterium]|nr:IS1380 family transposase [Desulfobacterales bacterium]